MAKVGSALAVVTMILAILAALACGGAATPVPESNEAEARVSATVGAMPATQAPPSSEPAATAVSSTVGTPVPRSAVGNTFEEPLSSGLSVADVVENALPSVVHIIAGSGTGTGFIVSESGLVVTNKHVVNGTSQVTLRLASGGNFQGRVSERHPSLDLAYIEIDANRSFTPIVVGDSGKIRVGETVIAIGFPLGRTLGLEPTVSVGIVSAKRNDRLQTDTSLNPGNSGGPLLNMFGQAIGVVTSRVDSTSGGRAVSGIAFAIPINEVKSGLGRQVSPSGRVLPTPTPTPFPVIGPTPDVEATRAAMEAVDAHRRQQEEATRTAIEAKQEAERYAASLEATRIAELPTSTPTPTPTPEPTPTPTPTPTPHPATYCEEWEAMVLDWIKQGNNYQQVSDPFFWPTDSVVPVHPRLSAQLAAGFCIIDFPSGVLHSQYIYGDYGVGYKSGQIVPGTYEYRSMDGSKRVNSSECYLYLNRHEDNQNKIDLPYGEPFTFEFFQYHGRVKLEYRYGNCVLFRIGD